jgi:proliferating cell nuclear antigen PCNA
MYQMDIQLLPISQGKTDIFTSIFQHIRAFTEHISLICSPTGIYFQTMDAARVSIVELTLPHTWFDSYTFTYTGDVVIGINTNILFKILNAREKQQKIQLTYKNDDSFEIHFTSEDKSVFDKHFCCPLIDLESEIMKIPDTIEYAAEFTLPSSNFATIIYQLKTFGDTLDIECTEEHIQLVAKSTESGTMSVEVPIDELNSFAINEGEELRMGFSLACLHNICLFNKTAKEMMIRLVADYPLSVIFPITEEDAYLKVYLAPKIVDS